MEQSKITLIHFYVGIFVIGIVLMTFSLQKQFIENLDLAFSIAIYLIDFSLLLCGLSFYCRFRYVNDLFKKQGIKKNSQLFIITNAFWFLLFFTFFLDELLNESLHSFDGADVVFMILLFGALIVNFILVVFSLHTNFETPLLYFKKNLRIQDFIAILIVGVFIAIFSIITLFLIYVKHPTTAICFTAFNLILINTLSAIFKNYE